MDESFREKFSSGKLTSKKTLSVIAFIVLALGISAPSVIAQTTGSNSMELGSNGLKLYQGTINLNGQDIEDAGTTIWDASNGFIPSGQIDLATLAGNDLSVNGNALDVDSANIQSGTTASDVGLGNVQNEAQVAEAGDTMTGNLNMGQNIINFNIGEIDERAGGAGELVFASDARVSLASDDDSTSGGPYYCYMEESSGDWLCDGTKSWIHELNSTHNAVYTSQESPQVRAVYEGQVNVTNGKVNVSLPHHFSGTVSDSRPSLRVQATPHSLDDVAVTERSDKWLVIKADTQDKVTVDYRVTGIREGYEDKQVVRPKE